MHVGRRSLSLLRAFRNAAAAALCSLVVACGGGGGGSAAHPLPPLQSPPPGKYFSHIVIMIQENRTFDNLFATFPNADGTTIGKTHDGGTRKLKEVPLNAPVDLNNAYPYWLQDCDFSSSGRCKMDGFNIVENGGQPGTYVYRYVDPSQIRPYWDLAKQYVLSDHLFQTQGSGSFPAHQDLIRGGTNINATDSLIDSPTGSPWGCDAPLGTVTSLITVANQYEHDRGPFPCLSYATLRDLLDGAGVSWRYYAPPVGDNTGGDNWNAFDAIKAVRNSPEWTVNIAWPETKVFTDIDRDSLTGVSWVIPDLQNSDHPGQGSDTGPSWIAQVVNAIGESPAWKTTAILILWDDWGGWYDHVAPPGRHRSGGLGFRVPFIIVSPYAKTGYVSHADYEFGSIVRFVEDNWALGRLGTTDETSADFVNDFFDFKQKPRPFQPISAKYSKQYFEHQTPSNKPVDTE